MSAECSLSTTPLRNRQQAATREEIVSVAMQLLKDQPDVSHELIAKTSGMSARTVYRHFPDRASLMIAVWQRLREMMQIRFPASEEEILPLAQQAFGALNAHEDLVHAVMNSVAGARIGSLPAYEGVGAFTASLKPHMKALEPKHRRLMIGIFTALYSAPFWQLLRTRGQLSDSESLEGTTLLFTILLEWLHSKSNQKKRKK